MSVFHSDVLLRSPSTPDKHDAWVIWLHDLGGRGEHLELQLGDAIPWVKWSFPNATVQRVTCQPGRSLPSWFDIKEVPIPCGQEVGIDGEVRTTSDALQEPGGLGAAVSMVHAMLTQAESLGYPSTRLVLGGSGQGGALALLAGRLYSRPLGGIVSFSGWHLRQHWRPKKSAPNSHVPVLLCHGEEDEKVPLPCLQESVDLLLSTHSAESLQYHIHPVGGHEECHAFQRHLLDFLSTHLPRSARPDAVAGSTAPSDMLPAPAQSRSVIKIGGQRRMADAVSCGSLSLVATVAAGPCSVEEVSHGPLPRPVPRPSPPMSLPPQVSSHALRSLSPSRSSLARCERL